MFTPDGAWMGNGVDFVGAWRMEIDSGLRDDQDCELCM